MKKMVFIVWGRGIMYPGFADGNEREIIVERTRAGLQAARARGRKGGRKAGLSDEAKRKAQIAGTLYKAAELTTDEIMSAVKIKSRGTLYKYLRVAGIEFNN